MSDFDLIAIGDITTDAFIKLKEAEVHCDINHEHCTITMDFGAKIPYESVTEVPAVGNSPNAAVAVAKLGLRAALVANLGDDDQGEAALTRLEQSGVNTKFVKRHPGKKTNYHYVLWFNDDRTILVKHEEYSYTLPLDFARGKPPQWIYLSSLGPSSIEFHKTIAEYLRQQPTVKLAFQPGTFQLRSPAAMTPLYQRAEALFVNREEAVLITGQADATFKDLIVGLHRLGPKIVAITDGPRGAYASDGITAWFIPPYPDPQPPLQRTGAGDAFAATFTAALILSKSVPAALRWAPINSMSVVQKIGAQAGLLTRPELEHFLAAAPPEYEPKEI